MRQLGGAGTTAKPLRGTGDGKAILFGEPDTSEGFPLYGAAAVARRGDIVMEVVVFDSQEISEKTIVRLAERQLERL
jgi:hypothetical protein